MSLELRFCASRKGGTGGGGQVQQSAKLASGFGCRKPLVGTGWAISRLLCTNGLKDSHVVLPFLAVKLLSWSVRVVIARELMTSGCGFTHKSAQDGCNGIESS